MLFFPLRTDRRLKATPWVNYALIAINVVIFILTMNQIQQASLISNQIVQLQSSNHPAAAAQIADLLARLDAIPVIHYYLQPRDTQLYQFLSYQFLHADIWHLLGNMIFLFVFGNSVEDRLGKVAYIFFYLAAGVVAGLGHSLIESSPILGASGSIAGVTGAYLALFPLSVVTIFYWFFFIGSFEVSSMLLILFRVGQDALFQLWGVGGVAYLAHLAGYAFGFVLGMGMLLSRLLPREPYDMLSLIEHRRRRSQFKQLTRRGRFQPWESGAKAGETDAATDGQAFSPEEQQVMDLRAQVSAGMARHDLHAAAKAYQSLIELDPQQVMQLQQQLDLANHYMAEGRYDIASHAYERFLEAYRAYPDRQNVQLILGLIYARYLDQPDRAAELLTAALPRLDGDDKQLAEQVLGEVG